jgi:hypothetical protein
MKVFPCSVLQIIQKKNKSFQICRVLVMVTAFGIIEFLASSIIHHKNIKWKYRNSIILTNLF